MARPRILMIAPVFYPYPPVWPEGMVNAKLALAMRKAGWHLDAIIGGYPDNPGRYPSQRIHSEDFSQHDHVVPLQQPRSHLKRILNAMRAFTLTGQLLRQLDWGMAVLGLAERLHARFHYDLILSRAVPDYAHFAAALIQRRTGLPWIANWNDPTPNHKFPPPYGEGPASPLSPFHERWYRVVGRHCTWHTFPSPRLLRYMSSYLPGDVAARSSVIPHIAMEGFSIPSIPHGGFSICYAGSVLPPRDVAVFLEGVGRFWRQTKAARPVSVRFLVDKPDLVAECASTPGLGDTVTIEPTVPYSEMPAALARSDVLVIIEAPVAEGIFMPAKLVDYVQIGRPILALSPLVGTVADILMEHGGGIAVDCSSPDAISQGLMEMYTHWSQGTLEAAYSSQSLRGLFSESHVLDLYRDLIRRFTS